MISALNVKAMEIQTNASKRWVAVANFNPSGVRRAARQPTIGPRPTHSGIHRKSEPCVQREPTGRVLIVVVVMIVAESAGAISDQKRKRRQKKNESESWKARERESESKEEKGERELRKEREA